ncbi:hypothetical protein ScPMuIL_018952 [Solemya velum]
MNLQTGFAILLQVLLWERDCDGQLASELRRFSLTPGDLNGHEPYTNLTIDQIITQALGGIDVAANKMVARGGKILAELDMLLTEEQFVSLYKPPSNDMRLMPYFDKRFKRKAVRQPDLRWTNGVVPYRFARGHFSDKEIYFLKQAMTEWEKYTCIKFHKAKSTDYNSIRIQNGQGCNSQLGMVGGDQVLNLEAPGCRWKGLYLHELGHALGLVHEHQLPDRDKYIDILYNNVEPSMRIWFNKYSSQEVNQYEVPYEYSSVMHYGITAFSSDGKSQTIRAKDPSKEETIGQVWRKELSFTDIKTVNAMYQCADHCPNNLRCKDGGFLDQNCKCICKDGTDSCQEGNDVQADERCFDEHNSWQCNVWAGQGECERNSDFMHRACQKACHRCGKETEEDTKRGDHVATWAWQWFGMFTNLFPKDWTIGVCEDNFSHHKCGGWAKNGDCLTNRKWMDRFCRKTCGFCQNSTKEETNCKDAHDNSDQCDKWAREGECKINPTWMLANCRRGCKTCHKSGDEPEEEEDEEEERADEPIKCEDKHNSLECKKWANKGECNHNPGWMIPNCRKSCKKCHDGSCKNIYDDKECQHWVADEECMKNPDWMGRNCKKACSLCSGDDGTGSEEDTEVDIDTGTGNRDDYDRDYERDDTQNDNDNEDSGECVDNHDSQECKVWAESGHCDVNPGWMLKHCKKACGECRGGTDGTTTTKDDAGKSDATCTDKLEHCTSWAKHGYCESNPAYSLVNCRKSCRNCNGCRDEHLLCRVWARGGQCPENAGYMMRFCQKSCGVCKS